MVTTKEESEGFQPIGHYDLDDVEVEEKEIDKGSARIALFAAVEGDGTEQAQSCRPLVRLLFRQGRQATVLASIQSHKFHKGHARRFFAGVAPILKKVIEEEIYVPASAYESDDETNDGAKKNRKQQTIDPIDVVPDAQSTEALEFIKAVSMCLGAYLEGLVERRSDTSGDTARKRYQVMDEVFTVAELLHGVLFSLHSCGSKGIQVQAAIASICEMWWLQRFVDREAMVVNLLPYLAAKSLDAEAQKSDVKRLFVIRDALGVLDFDNQSIAYLKSLLLRTVSSPLFLKQTEGKRFISSLFYLHQSMVRDLHQAIRVQIPEAKKQILEAYGDIYFRAWKETEPESQVRNAIEEIALQDLMYAVLHVATPGTAKSLMVVLEPFHASKRTSEVENMLHRMYGPILWRSLRAANPRVRVNAATVLSETFPLKASSASPKEMERAVQKGTEALKSLLRDQDPRVRVAGSEATATVLVTFWDVLPVPDIRVLLNHIVAEHASDASSSAVRAGAVNSIILLLEAEESHAVLRALLPLVGNLIHDKVERVRLATVKLLLQVKKIPGIKYYHVVPVEHLQAQLAASYDNPHGPVPSALTELMMNSYCPQGPNVSGTEQVKRTIAFLTSDPVAAQVFYSNIASHLCVGSVAKLAAMLLRCLSASVDTDKARMAELQAKKGKKRRRYGKQQDGDDEEVDEEGETTLTAANTSLMASLARTICCLWESIETELKEPENEPCNEFLLDAFSGAVLTDVHSHFEEKAADVDVLDKKGLKVRDDCYRTCAAILRCAGRLPPKAVKGLASHISTKLADLKANIDDDTVHENITPHIALLCLWGMVEDVATSLSDSIQSAFGDSEEPSLNLDDSSSSSNKRRSRRNVKVDLAVPPLPARVALEVLGDLLRGPDPSSVAAREAILSSTAACTAFENALELGTVRAERLLQSNPMFPLDTPEKDIELILKSCEAYGRFALHKEASKDGPPRFSLQARTLLDWTTDKVIPVLTKQGATGESTPFGELNISRISANSASPGHPTSPSPMSPPRQRTNRNATPDRDGSFGSVQGEVHISSNEESSALLAHGAAVTLLQSSCVIFSEWLAVGGSGSDEIAASACNWSRIFSNSKDKAALQTELLPAFTRLMIQLCKTGSNFSLLEKLIASCDEIESEEEEVNVTEKTISTLLRGRDVQGNFLTDGVVRAVLGAARSLLGSGALDNDGDEKQSMPCTLSELWDVKQGSIASSLSAVLLNKQASIALAQKLVSRFDSNIIADDQTQVALYEAKLLWFLFENASETNAVEMKAVMRRLDADKFAGEGAVNGVLRNVAESLAV